ncbi:TKL/LISK/LISK-DD1 protein kinase [Allomyces macrogynus ATCC 38327]|uniref:TKL/LISK/LISK-DD1 protein kinase n=1 Tax=Allomyces macrogynus (strain ATCC 38327) TaxID=578462 RepID=A0A0L0SSL5_ALLM3|nr:TKL/LISK/LISK-DD1 protein kinase, variant [Allomyces macrogynus ATCC 38327]KNE65492.1 TKL/LISK/LISK-DD1 protein kinase [Allomyces macrogynus ATCC 38327]|eukprot:KNE65491.1 TKL/LISK/LISK-DD1 protein kinase, variant [Allomyces macrogynus ATCC 38327]
MAQPTTPAPPQPLPMLAWDDIVLHQEIGRGMFGVVSRGEYLGTPVAVKEVFRLPDVDFAKYFEREIRALAEARHPNCIQFMGIVRRAGGGDCIVTEYVGGGNLDDWIRGPKPFPWRQRVAFAQDIARALAYLHAQDLIHRDLKGSNLLVSETGRVKVCDFGFTRLRAKTADERKRLTYCGTDAYMAPEIMLCMNLDASVDIFSYGVILLEMISRTNAERFRRVMPGFGIDPQSIPVPPDCPRPLLDLALSCIADESAARPTWRTILDTLKTLDVDDDIDEDPLEGCMTASTSRMSLADLGPSTGKVTHAHPLHLVLPKLPSIEKCAACGKRMGMHRRMACREKECGYVAHRRCVEGHGDGVGNESGDELASVAASRRESGTAENGAGAGV